MAHEIDFSNGRQNMAYTGEAPWHGLGFALDPEATIEQWKVAAGFEWEAVPSEVYFKDGKGRLTSISSKRALFRSDTQQVLGVVSAGYHPVQPADVLGFFKDLVESYKAFTLETAGCLRGGRKIWALAKAKDEIRLGKEDVIKRYLLLATSFDLSLPTIAQQTSIRVVCNNTLTAAYQAGESGGEKQIRVSHLEHFSGDRVKQSIMLNKEWDQFSAAVGLMAKKNVSEAEARQYFLDVIYPPSFRKTSKRFFQAGADRQVEKMMAIYANAPGQSLSSAKKTVWGALNAVTYWTDHSIKSVNQDLRLDKAWFGKGQELKLRAFDLGLQMAS